MHKRSEPTAGPGEGRTPQFKRSYTWDCLDVNVSEVNFHERGPYQATVAAPRRRLPRLDNGVLWDPDRIGVVLGELFDATPAMKRHRQRIIRLQKRLRKLVSDEAWRVYLDLESAEAGRLNDAADLVAAWAFLQGRRRGRQSERRAGSGRG